MVKGPADQVGLVEIRYLPGKGTNSKYILFLLSLGFVLQSDYTYF